MLYLSEKDIRYNVINWNETIEVIDNAVKKIKEKQFHQPIKPYLYFDNPKNRIIAMPARLGNDKEGVSGIKWIASFPDNINIGLKRANSITILNNNLTGKAECLINTSYISAIRTASVTGYLLNKVLNRRNSNNLTAAIIGFGPIGKTHLEMLEALFSKKINEYKVFDIKEVDTTDLNDNVLIKTKFCKCLNEAFTGADIIITCTVSSKGYINIEPKKGAIVLNISLRDFVPEFVKYVDINIVDSWDEVCRANTDIYHMNCKGLIHRDECYEIQEIDCIDLIANKTVFFNPMGMATFDVAIAKYFFELSKKEKLGVLLED